MNAIIETINAAGQAFIRFALPMFIQSSVLILILLLVDMVLRRRVRAVFRYWIWMLVLLKLVLPPSLWSPVSIGTWLGETLEPPAIVVSESPVPPQEEKAIAVPKAKASPEPVDWVGDGTTAGLTRVREGYVPTRRLASASDSLPMEAAEAGQRVSDEPTPDSVTAEVGTAPPTATPLSWQALVFLAWIAIALALLLLLIQRAWFVRGLIAQSQEAPPRLRNALGQCRVQVGVKRAVPIRVSSNATSPAVCGLFRPSILIPKTLVPRLQPHDLQAVLLHELAHIKRGDLWVNLIQTLLQVIYFYNPFLWLANVVIRRVREQAVDEAVLVAMGEAAHDYPETLLNVAKLAFKQRPALSLRLIGVVESKSALRSRIKHILHRPLPKTAKLGLLGLMLVFIVAAFLLPMANATEQIRLFSSEGGPLEIELIAVRPNAGDKFYDPSGQRLDWDPGFLTTLSYWGREFYGRDFIFKVPDTEQPLLFAGRCGIRYVDTPHHSDIGYPLPMGLYEGSQLYEWSVQVLRSYRSGRILGLIPRFQAVHYVDLALRYFFGPPLDPICTFTGPFHPGETFKSDGDGTYAVAFERVLPSQSSPIRLAFSANVFNQDDKPIIIHTTDGRRHRTVRCGPGHSFVQWGGSLDRIAKITYGERPHERIFHNVLVRYPGDSSRADAVSRSYGQSPRP